MDLIRVGAKVEMDMKDAIQVGKSQAVGRLVHPRALLSVSALKTLGTDAVPAVECIMCSILPLNSSALGTDAFCESFRETVSVEELEALSVQSCSRISISRCSCPWWLVQRQKKFEMLVDEADMNEIRVKTREHFPIVRLSGVSVTEKSSVWFYQAILSSDGLMQLGWADWKVMVLEILNGIMSTMDSVERNETEHLEITESDGRLGMLLVSYWMQTQVKVENSVQIWQSMDSTPQLHSMLVN